MTDKRNKIEELIQRSIDDPKMDIREKMVSVLVSAIEADEGLYIYGTSSADEEDGELTVTMTQDDRGNRFLPVYTSWTVAFGNDDRDSQKKDGSGGKPLKSTGKGGAAVETRKLYIDSLVKYVLEQSDLAGMEINPDGNRCRLSRELLWKVFEKREAKGDDQEFYNRMIRKALKFAEEFYAPKGIGNDGNFSYPYLEMMHILNDMNMAVVDPTVMIAGILYYAAEQTAMTLDMIRWQFGNQVADLLDVYLRHMNLDEEVRHQQFISDLKKADTPVKVLALADILVRQRNIMRSSRVYSGKVWNPDDPEQMSYVRYLSEVQDAVYDLQFNDVMKYAYWELVDSFKDLFVEFWFDRENLRMYQNFAGEKYVIARDNLQAQPYSGEIPKNAIKVGRKYAERIEDNWNEEYDREQSASGLQFENFFVAVKHHLKGVLQKMSEEDLDRLMISNMEFLKAQYDLDMKNLKEGGITEDIFLTECSAKAADTLERIQTLKEKEG